MEYILEVNHLEKRYDKFHLKDISFSLPYGTIMGFVGENGAGKTTTMGCILQTLKKDAGTVKIFGKELQKEDRAPLEEIGVVYDAENFPPGLTPKQLSKVMDDIYSNWDDRVFFEYLKQFQLDENKKIKTLSKGMGMKLGIAAALAHKPKLLILDEATSGLDPVVRDEMLDVFLDFVQEEDHAVFLSSHITTDLEKVADYITFIHNGTIILTASKDDLMYRYGVLRCTGEQFQKIEKEDILAYRKRDYQIDVLVENLEEVKRKYGNVVADHVSIDDILLLLVRGERV